MTSSAQQPPTPQRAGTGSDDEETTTAAATAAEPKPKPKPQPKAEAETEPTKSEPEPTKSEAKAKAEPAAETETESEETAGHGESGVTSGAEPEPEADPGATTAAKSRLPALVRTVSATAIGKPQRRTGPVGRPGRAVLAGAAVAGALLVSVPLLTLGGDDDKDRKTSASAGTVLGGDEQEAPGEFAQTAPDTGSEDDEKKADASGKPKKPAKEAVASAPSKNDAEKDKSKDDGKKTRTQKQRSEKQSDGTKSEGTKDTPKKAAPGLTLSAPVSFRSHLSGRCIDVPGSDFSDGKQLHMWDCNGAPAQKFQFASDGTIRIQGKCLDVANANFNDRTAIQIAWCNGADAQKFALNASHDLVNTVVGKCVDINGSNRDNRAPLELWGCTGRDNQKWSV